MRDRKHYLCWNDTLVANDMVVLRILRSTVDVKRVEDTNFSVFEEVGANATPLTQK